ncbi:hypothetical protein GCM10011367_26390 [Marinicauda pacifica]|nr:hypothetical protein GCM10011367_26390 [Marinicauda pacifica]
MSTRPRDMSALIVGDPHSRKLALGRIGDRLMLPMVPLEAADGRQADSPRISRKRLGAAELRAGAFMDAALRSGFECLGMLIARPVLHPVGPRTRSGLWSRLARHRLEPDRSALTYLGRMISPTDAQSRQHVRVFAAPVARVTNSLKIRGSCDRTIWMTPEAADRALNGTGLEAFASMSLSAMGGRPRPLLVSWREGRQRQSRL